MTSGVRVLTVALLALTLGGCASRGSTPPGSVAETIAREAAQAAKPAAKPVIKPDQAAIEQALLPALDAPSPDGKSKEARFDLVVQNAPATQVFTAIVSGTPFSMLIGPDVGGTITLNLKNVTLREALDTIRELYGYEYRVKDNRITIQSNALQTRVFKVNYLQGRRIGRTDTRLTATSITAAPGGTGGASGTTPTPGIPATPTPAAGGSGGANNEASARVSTQSDGDFWDELRRALATIVGTADGRSVVANPTSGVIVVRAMPLELRNVETYLNATQLMVERQVMLEAKIIEVDLREGLESGINWASFQGIGNRVTTGIARPSSTLRPTGGPAVSVDPALDIASSTEEIVSGGSAVLAGVGGAVLTGAGNGVMGLALQTRNFAALLNFLETQGSVHVLSSPRVATLNNQKAVLKVGQDEFFVTNASTTTTTGTGGNTTSPTVTLQPFFSGIAFDVTPQIDEGNQIILHVHPSVSLVEEKVKNIDLGSGGVLRLPLATSKINETDSVVRVTDGQIVAIGGLMHQRQYGDRSQLPGASNLGGLSLLLGQNKTGLIKSELVILIKPTIIREDGDWQTANNEALNRLQHYAPAQPVVITP